MNPHEARQLREIRTALDTDLTTAEIRTAKYLGPQIHPPVVILEPGDPYVEDAETAGYGLFRVRYNLVVLTARGDGQVQSDALDDEIQSVLDAVTEWDLGQVAGLSQIQLGERRFLGAVIEVSTLTQL